MARLIEHVMEGDNWNSVDNDGNPEYVAGIDVYPTDDPFGVRYKNAIQLRAPTREQAMALRKELIKSVGDMGFLRRLLLT